MSSRLDSIVWILKYLCLLEIRYKTLKDETLKEITNHDQVHSKLIGFWIQ
jgi:hypothetical protein